MSYSQFPVDATAAQPAEPSTAAPGTAFAHFQTGTPAEQTTGRSSAPAAATTAPVPEAASLPKRYSNTRGGVFSNAQKEIIEQYCDETSTAILVRLQQADPNMTQTVKQVQGTVDKQRRKKRRREDSGVWTEAERRIVQDNLTKTPSAIRALLKANIADFRKNLDQVRDLKQQMSTVAKNAALYAQVGQ